MKVLESYCSHDDYPLCFIPKFYVVLDIAKSKNSVYYVLGIDLLRISIIHCIHRAEYDRMSNFAYLLTWIIEKKILSRAEDNLIPCNHYFTSNLCSLDSDFKWLAILHVLVRLFHLVTMLCTDYNMCSLSEKLRKLFELTLLDS